MGISGSYTGNNRGATATCNWTATENYVSNNYSVNFKVTVNSSCSGVEVILQKGSTYIFDVGGDGTRSVNKTVTLSSGTYNLRLGVYKSGSGSYSGTNFTLGDINRTSTPTLSASSVELGDSITINISRKASSFTHTITGGFSTSALTDTLASNVDTSASVSFPVDIFASRITDSTSKTYIIRTTTYSDSSVIGYIDKTITLIVPETYVDPQTGSTVTIAPRLSHPTVTEIGDVLTHFEKYYNNRSKLSMSCDVGLSFDSPITSYTLTFNGVTKTGATLPVDMDNVISVNSSELPRTYPVTLTAVDGRGRSATVSTNIYVQNYSLYVSGVDIYRSDASGNRDTEGTYITVTGTYAKTSIKDNSGKQQNFVRRLIYVDGRLVWQSGNIKTTDADNTTVILPTSGSGIYDINTSYQVTVGYGDAVTSYVVKGEAIIPTALRPISINADGSAIAFKKPALNTDVGFLNYYTPSTFYGDIYVKPNPDSNTGGNIYVTGNVVASHIGQIIMSTTLDTEAKVIAEYGGEEWLQHDGYMLRGASSGVIANRAVKTSGEEEVTLTAAQSGVPAHSHPHGHTHGTGDSAHSYFVKASGGFSTETVGGISGDGWKMYQIADTQTWGNMTATGSSSTENTSDNTATNASQAHNNMPPYKNVYIWERIK